MELLGFCPHLKGLTVLFYTQWWYGMDPLIDFGLASWFDLFIADYSWPAPGGLYNLSLSLSWPNMILFSLILSNASSRLGFTSFSLFSCLPLRHSLNGLLPVSCRLLCLINTLGSFWDRELCVFESLFDCQVPLSLLRVFSFLFIDFFTY